MTWTKRCSLIAAAIGCMAFVPAHAAFGQAHASVSVCKDGTTEAVTGRGACAHHGGVDAAATRAATMVTCTDGSMSKPGRGACARHGGIKGASLPASTMTPPPVDHHETATHSVATHSKTTTTTTTTHGDVGGAEDNNPHGAIARCKDGLYSHAHSHRGACSRHGGVATWM